MERIIVTIAKKGGTTTVEAQGIVGSSCQDVTQRLQDALGTTTNVEYTGEFYEVDEKQKAEY